MYFSRFFVPTYSNFSVLGLFFGIFYLHQTKTNAPSGPEAIVPKEKTINFKDNEPEVTLDALTFWVLRIKRS